jgi:hypothetical protein
VLSHQAGVVMLGVIYRNTLTWACSGCGQQVTERGPARRPVHVEHGHVPDCARLARDQEILEDFERLLRDA